jgi:ribosomal protein L7/L12
MENDTDPVVTIIRLFDELDAYEAINLVDLFAQRGYSLKIDRSREVLTPETGEENFKLILFHYPEDAKIQAIKAIKSIFNDYEGNWEDCENFGLKEAKDFVELPSELWISKPLCTGTHSDLKFIKVSLAKSFPQIKFKIINSNKIRIYD